MFKGRRKNIGWADKRWLQFKDLADGGRGEGERVVGRGQDGREARVRVETVYGGEVR
jgi:hypothetical protein